MSFFPNHPNESWRAPKKRKIRSDAETTKLVGQKKAEKQKVLKSELTPVPEITSEAVESAPLKSTKKQKAYKPSASDIQSEVSDLEPVEVLPSRTRKGGSRIATRSDSSPKPKKTEKRPHNRKLILQDVEEEEEAEEESMENLIRSKKMKVVKEVLNLAESLKHKSVVETHKALTNLMKVKTESGSEAVISATQGNITHSSPSDPIHVDSLDSNHQTLNQHYTHLKPSPKNKTWRRSINHSNSITEITKTVTH